MDLDPFERSSFRNTSLIQRPFGADAHCKLAFIFCKLPAVGHSSFSLATARSESTVSSHADVGEVPIGQRYRCDQRVSWPARPPSQTARRVRGRPVVRASRRSPLSRRASRVTVGSSHVVDYAGRPRHADGVRRHGPCHTPLGRRQKVRLRPRQARARSNCC